MYKATRQLIAARQKHAYYVVEPVKVQNIGGGRANDCFYNATDVLDADSETKLVGGWIVAPFCKDTNSTAIISHFWNSKNGKHFDTTPGIPSDYEYVVDMNLVVYGQKHYDNLASNVCTSLLLQHNVFHLVSSDAGERVCAIGVAKELNCKNLFAEHVINKVAA